MKAWSSTTTPGNNRIAWRALRRPLERSRGAALLLALAAVFLASGAPACADEGEHPLPPADIPAPKTGKPVVGERLGFHGRWFGIPVGYGWVQVKELVEIDGRPAYHIEGQGHTNEVLSKLYPIHDVIDSYLDAETLKPVRFEKHQREGHYRSDEIVTFDQQNHTAHYQSLLNHSQKTIDLPDDFQDLISALYWLRAQPLEPNQALSVNLYTDEKIYQTQILVTSLVTLELLKRGTFRALVVEPKASFKGLLVKRGRIWAYISADEHRVPLLVKATTPWGSMSAVIDDRSIPSELKGEAVADSAKP